MRQGCWAAWLFDVSNDGGWPFFKRLYYLDTHEVSPNIYFPNNASREAVDAMVLTASQRTGIWIYIKPMWCSVSAVCVQKG